MEPSPNVRSVVGAHTAIALPTRRGLFRTAAAIALGSWAARCGGAGEPFDGVTVLINAEPEHLDPRYPGDALGATISRLVYGGLLDADPHTFAPRLDMAEFVDAGDPLRIRVRLRSGLTFQDGSPVRADDVTATYRAILDPRGRSTVRGTYVRVFESVRTVDSRTVEFRLTGPDGTYPSLLQQTILRERDTARPELAALPGNESSFVGAGAMRVGSLAPGAWEFTRVQRVTGRPNSVRFLTMHDPNTLALRLLHGAADIGEVKPELFPVFQGRRSFALNSARGVGLTYLALRNDHPALALPAYRHGVAAAVDRAGLLAGKLGAYGVAATGPLPPLHWAYEGAVPVDSYEPARARGLLAPVRGERMVLRISNVRFIVTVARAIAEMLRAVGLDVEVRQSDLPALLADLRAGRYDLALLTMPDLSDPWGLAWLFASTSRPTPENPGAGGNRWRYANPALDAVLESGRRAVGEQARRPYYAQAQRILAEDLPVVPLWHADLVFASGPRVRNVHPRGDAQWDFLLQTEWAR